MNLFTLILVVSHFLRIVSIWNINIFFFKLKYLQNLSSVIVHNNIMKFDWHKIKTDIKWRSAN